MRGLARGHAGRAAALRLAVAADRGTSRFRWRWDDRASAIRNASSTVRSRRGRGGIAPLDSPGEVVRLLGQERVVEHEERLERHGRAPRPGSWSRPAAGRRPSRATGCRPGASADRRCADIDRRGWPGDPSRPHHAVGPRLDHHRRTAGRAIQIAADGQDRIAHDLGLEPPQPHPPEQVVAGIDLLGKAGKGPALESRCEAWR